MAPEVEEATPAQYGLLDESGLKMRAGGMLDEDASLSFENLLEQMKAEALPDERKLASPGTEQDYVVHGGGVLPAAAGVGAQAALAASSRAADNT